MNGIAVLVSLTAIGVDYGWQPSSDGQLEYIIQIEPALLEGLRNGDEIVSEILPEARGVRKFRIRVGTGPVPKIGHLQRHTAPRSLTTPVPNTFTGGASGRGGSAVLPPQHDWGSSSIPARGGAVGSDFRPDGFLNLPPPPVLLGPDGKSSVLVRPGSRSPNGVGVLPPRVTDNTPAASHTGTLDLAPVPVPGATSNGTGGWQPPSITAPSNSPQPSGGVYPPPPGGMGAPLNNNNVTPPSNARPMRPIPSPGLESGSPDPIRFGQSGIKPPASSATVSHGATRPSSSQGEANAKSDGIDLLAEVTDANAAALKPTIDKETAEQLEPKPWKTLVLTSLALFASLAANVYLGWVALGIYRRYRDMVEQLHQAQASLT